MNEIEMFKYYFTKFELSEADNYLKKCEFHQFFLKKYPVNNNRIYLVSSEI
jgi:hypothetical protein